jgi:hypothetical protein
MIIPSSNVRTLRRSTTRQRIVRSGLSLFVAATVMAACGGSDAGDATPTTPSPAADDTADDPTSETTTPETTTSPTAPAETVAATTEPPASAASTGDALTFPAGPDWVEWLAVRRVTSDDGYWLYDDGVPLPVEARAYWARCEAEVCTAPQFDVRYVGAVESAGEPYFDATVEGQYMTWGNSSAVACVDPATNEVTGPLETTQTSGWTLEPIDAAGAVWQGNYETLLTNDGSAACLAERVGYRASMLLFDPTKTPLADDPAGIWWGENSASPGVERLIRACEPAEGCDAVLRIAVDQPSAAAPTRTPYDVALSRGPDGVLYGSVDYVDACLSDLDRSWIADVGYDVTREFWVSVYDLPGTDEGRVAEMVDRTVGATRADLPAEQAAVCAPFETTDRMIALANDTSVVLDWADEAGVAVPLPAA